MDQVESPALIAAGLLSVMIFPLVAVTLLRRGGHAGNADEDERSDEGEPTARCERSKASVTPARL